MDLLVQRSYLTDRCKKVELHELITILSYYIENDYSIYAITLTFSNVKYKKQTKRPWDECEGPEIHSLVSQYEGFSDMRCFFRLDIGDSCRYHYHGFIITKSIIQRQSFMAKWNKTYGKLHDQGQVADLERACSYVLGCPIERRSNHVFADSKFPIKDYLDSYYVSNLYR